MEYLPIRSIIENNFKISREGDNELLKFAVSMGTSLFPFRDIIEVVNPLEF